VRTLLCTQVRPEASAVMTFTFADVSGADFIFRAGQFVTLKLPLESGPVWRSFTIASSPARGGQIGLTVKAQAAGQATRWMHERLRPGMTLDADGPHGRFHPAERPERPLVLASAGSGATPMAAMLRWLDDAGIGVPVHYIHCGHTSADLLFREEIEAIAGRRAAFRLDWLATSVSGRPDAAGMRALVPSLAEADVFCCGPSGFMAVMREAHALAGGECGAWHEESFHPEAAEGAAVTATTTAAAGETGFAVRFLPQGIDILALPGETILDAGLRCGLPLASSCRQGVCGTCRLRKLSGEVEMHQDGGLFDDEVEAGEILACCSRPLTALVVECA